MTEIARAGTERRRRYAVVKIDQEKVGIEVEGVPTRRSRRIVRT